MGGPVRQCRAEKSTAGEALGSRWSVTLQGSGNDGSGSNFYCGKARGSKQCENLEESGKAGSCSNG